jgi:hypothetical protein
MRRFGLCMGLLAVGTVVVLGGCSGVVLPEETGSARSVTSVPGPGFIAFDNTSETTVIPADSDLLKALNAEAACPIEDELQESSALPFAVIYEVEDAGRVVAETSIIDFEGQQMCHAQTQIDAEFVIEDGCLSLSKDLAIEDEEFYLAVLEGALAATNEALMEELTSPLCDDTGLALGRNGVITDDETDEEFICVTVTLDAESATCSQADGVWTARQRTSVTYTAAGSLDGVSVAQWQELCGDGTTTTVDIAQGDSVTTAFISATTYSSSPSPEALGCTEEAWPPELDESGS